MPFILHPPYQRKNACTHTHTHIRDCVYGPGRLPQGKPTKPKKIAPGERDAEVIIQLPGDVILYVPPACVHMPRAYEAHRALQSAIYTNYGRASERAHDGSCSNRTQSSSSGGAFGYVFCTNVSLGQCSDVVKFH